VEGVREEWSAEWGMVGGEEEAVAGGEGLVHVGSRGHEGVK